MFVNIKKITVIGLLIGLCGASSQILASNNETAQAAYQQKKEAVAAKYPELETTFAQIYLELETLKRTFSTERGKIVADFNASKMTKSQAKENYQLLIEEAKPKLGLIKQAWANILQMHKNSQQKFTLSDLGLEQVDMWSILEAHLNGDEWCKGQGELLSELNDANSLLLERQYRYSYIRKECERKGLALAEIWAENWKDSQGPVKESSNLVVETILDAQPYTPASVEKATELGIKNVGVVEIFEDGENVPQKIEDEAKKLMEQVGQKSEAEIQKEYMEMLKPYLGITIQAKDGSTLEGLGKLQSDLERQDNLTSISLNTHGQILAFSRDGKNYGVVPFLKLAYLDERRKNEAFVGNYMHALGVDTDDLTFGGRMYGIEVNEPGLEHDLGVFDGRLTNIADLEWVHFDSWTGKLLQVSGKDVSSLVPNTSGKVIKSVRFDSGGEILEFE